MRAWSTPEPPALPGRGDPPLLYDTASGRLQPSAVRGPGGEARMYVCGITPYDATHLGHAATYVAFDVLHRAWLDAGLRVRYVQNVTDVDDPLFERARRDGLDWWELAARETELFREDMAALRVLPPTAYVAATEAVPQIVAAVRQLRERGAAYDVDADVYFPVSSDPRFGSVARLPAEEMLELFAERGGDPGRPGKKDPLDALLWRAERADVTDEPAWDGPTGQRGRPGWHIECTAIALEHLGAGFDVQGGGSDLAFPHHEMGASHAEVLTGVPFARTYVHAGMVGYEGAKMSKSRGNLVFVSALRRELAGQGADPAAIRLALLAHHYRSDWEWTADGLAAARRRLERWRAAVRAPAGPPAGDVLDLVRARLADDLDAPGALAAVDAWAEEQLARGGDDAGAPDLLARTADSLLGVSLR